MALFCDVQRKLLLASASTARRGTESHNRLERHASGSVPHPHVQGIEDAFGKPDPLEGTGLAQQGLGLRVRRVFQFVELVMATSASNKVKNAVRAKLGFKTYEVRACV